MEANHSVVPEVATVADYISSCHKSAQYTGSAGLHASDDGEGHASLSSPVTVAHVTTDGSNPSNSNVYASESSNVAHDDTCGLVPESKPNEVGSGSEYVSSHEAASYAGANVVDYDVTTGSISSMVDYQSTTIIENGNASGEAAGSAVNQQYEDVYTPEEERLWNMIRTNSLDFSAWTSLIDEIERGPENNILKIRKVYDAFLAEFPLCFGYWKKYADHEVHLGNIDKVIEVYERAVLAVTYSVDIWLHYCVFAISTYEDPEIIRRLFERGLAYVGTDYLSYPLWDEYIRYEESHHEWSYLAMIYTRILEHPSQELDRYYDGFKHLAASRPLSAIRTAEEAAMMTASMDTRAQGFENEVSLVGEQSSKSANGGLTEAEELEEYIAIREEMYKRSKEHDSKIVDFETAIRRPYFHVRPLDDPELANWHNYLDYIEKGDDFNKVVKLYERCMIACANYTEFWIRYVLCMEASGSMELAVNALARATQVFVKKQPEIHLFAARFKELCGDVHGARTEYELLYIEIAPCLLEAIVRHANMEYRLGNKELAFSLYEKFIAAEQGKDLSHIMPMLLVQYSRFLYLASGNAEKARDVLYGSLELVQLSKPLLESIIHMESILPLQKRIDYLDSLVEKFITPNDENPCAATTSDREELSCIYLEFLDLFGDAQQIKKADGRHSMLFSRQKSLLTAKKRHTEEFLVSDKSKMIKTYTGAHSPGQSVMGACPNAQSQWSTGYGQKTPAFPQTSQAQNQQWNPSYSAQAGYNAYGGYANYGQTQMPTSAPQTAYGAYPPSYPVQGYAQQTYGQPAATYSQHQAAVPQPYYGYY